MAEEKSERVKSLERLRNSIDGDTCIRQIDMCAKELVEINGLLKTVNTRDKKGKLKRLTSGDKQKFAGVTVRVRVIDSLVNLNFRRLAKLLPDLKQQEVVLGDGDGTSLLDGFTDAVKGFSGFVSAINGKKKKSAS